MDKIRLNKREKHSDQVWSDYINETKLSPPVMPVRQVNRTDLITKLNECRQLPLLLVRAPAGYGKTMVAAQWYQAMRASGAQMAWLSVDSLDNNIKRLLFHIVASLRRLRSEFGRSVIGQLNSPGKLSLASIAATLTQEIAICDHSVYLVIDDFHLLDNPEIIQLFELLLENPPPNLTLVILSRMTLPLATSKLKASGQFIEVTANELRFNDAEIGEFIGLENQIELPKNIIASLAKKTEGWIAGLKLTSLTLKGQENVNDFITSFSGSHYDIANFLAEEVLSKQTPDVQEFLLLTAPLDRMCPDLCNYVTGLENAQQLLKQLEQSGLFLISLDHEANWFRYHHLFADFMTRYLNSTRPDSAKELHRRASRWFAEKNLIDESIKHSLMAQDIETAIQLLDGSSHQMFYDGQLNALVHWVEKIDDAYLDECPSVLLNYAWVLILEWRFLQAGKVLKRVRNYLNHSNMENGDNSDKVRIEMILAHREMMLSQFSDDMQSVVEKCEQLSRRFEIDDPYLCGNLYTSLLYAEREFLNVANYAVYDEKAKELYQEAHSTFVLVWHGSIAGPTAYMQGAVEDAKKILNSAWKNAARISGEISPLAAMPALLLAEVLYEHNELERVNSLLDRYLPLAEQIGFVDQIIAGVITKAKILYRCRELGQAKQLLQKGEQQALSHNFTRLEVAIICEQVRQASIEGDKNIAKKHMVRLQQIVTKAQLKPQQGARSTHAMAALTWCRYYRLSGDYTESINLAKQWARFCENRGLYRDYVKFSATQIAAYQAQGEKRSAMRLLQQVLDNIEGRKLANSFFDEGPLIERMLVALLSSISESRVDLKEQTREIVKLVGAAPASLIEEEPAYDEPTESLDKHELTILRMVDEGYRNQEIADELNLTEGTVKWYLQNIYDKLGVRRRSVAAKMAKQLGLLVS